MVIIIIIMDDKNFARGLLSWIMYYIKLVVNPPSLLPIATWQGIDQEGRAANPQWEKERWWSFFASSQSFMVSCMLLITVCHRSWMRQFGTWDCIFRMPGWLILAIELHFVQNLEHSNLYLCLASACVDQDLMVSDFCFSDKNIPCPHQELAEHHTDQPLKPKLPNHSRLDWSSAAPPVTEPHWIVCELH